MEITRDSLDEVFAALYPRMLNEGAASEGTRDPH